ncbi:MAG: TonB-dependent receptor [Candidatus Solibacter sp.]|nr:TonB-dependent receptor [Candidatus Solibacter sp.]
MQLPKLLLLSALVSVPGGLLQAQGDRGTLTGTVTDSSTAVVPGAKVLITAETVATASGNYTLTGLPAGVYNLRVESDGFKVTERADVRVQVAQTFRVDVVLQLGTTKESVQVTAESPLLRTENAEQSVNVSGDKFNQLPLNFGTTNGGGGSVRNWLAFIVLSPGVSGSDQGASVNGLPTNLFRILIDGQDTTSQNQPDWVSTVAASSVEAIGEFSVQTSNFQAQYQGGLGAMYNFTAKSGTNKIHGSVYDYFTNETVFNARRHFQANVPRTRDRKTDAGFSVGGPVYIPKVYNGKNRTFFYFGLEFFRNNNISHGNLGTVPTAAFRKGDFSKALTGRQLATDLRGTPVMENTIFDPKSDVTFDGRIYRTLFPNNVIPASQLDPVALKVQDLIPQATNGELFNNYTYDLPNPREQNLPSLKLDHNIDPSKRLSFYWSYQTTRDVANNDPLPNPLTTKRDKTARGNTYRLNYDHSVTPTLIFHLGAGYRRFNNPDSASQDVLTYDAVKNLGLKGSQMDPAGFPRITGLSSGNYGGLAVGGGGGFGPTNAYNYYDDMLTLTADATYVRESHTFKVGGTMNGSMFSAENRNGATGNYAFSNSQTGEAALTGISLPSGTSVGLNYASFLLGATSGANVNALWSPQWRKHTWGLYVQDTWKATRKLTFDYGVRWDLQGTGHEIHWRNSSFRPSIANPSAGGLPGGLAFEGYGPGRCNCQVTDTYP